MRSISIDRERFDRLAALAAQRYGADLFLTDDNDPERSSVIGLNPYRELSVTAYTTRAELAAFAFGDAAPTFGFLAYQYGLLLKGLLSEAPSGFPLGLLKKYALTLSYNRYDRLLRIEEHDSYGGLTPDSLIDEAGNYRINLDPSGDPGPVSLTLDRDEYIERVGRTIEYIRGGYTYQLNLSTAFSLDWPGLDAAALFFGLWRRYPASHYAMITGGPFRLLSTSPERFIRVRGGLVVSEPIKGTVQLNGPVDDAVARLTTSIKEDAELSMIVDLIRNDISYHCEYGSVQVERHKASFVVDDLLQMYSRVTGRLRRESSCLDLLLDAFPCGSVTGCPKRKTMELIAELEPHDRDVYCGTIFAIRGERDMESSVAIRTGYYDTGSGILRFYAGSGIVVMSDPEAEYLETLAKAGKFLRAIDAKRSSRAVAVRTARTSDGG